MDLQEAVMDNAAAMAFDPANLERMIESEKIRLCSKLSRQGIPHKDLARFFNVCPKTVYNWLKKDIDHVVEELEVKSALDLIVENLSDLEGYERLCMREASCLGQDQLTIDPETGKGRLKDGDKKGLDAKIKFMTLAVHIRGMRINLLTQTGVIPKVAEKIYNTVRDNKSESAEIPADAEFDLTALSTSVIQKLKQQMNL